MPASVGVNGPLIEHYRKSKACLTRKEAARVLGMSETTLYYIERGRRGRYRTSPPTLKRIALLMKVEPTELAAERCAEQNGG